MERTTITSLRWVPRGRAKAELLVNNLNQDDIKYMVDEIKELTTLEQSLKNTNQSSTHGAFWDELDMEHYNTDDENRLSTDDDGGDEVKEQVLATSDFPGRQFFSAMESDLPEIVNDSYLKEDADIDSEEENDVDALKIRDTDSLLVTASADQTLPTLEVYVYDHETHAFYVHHEIMVGAPPLCVEWLDSVGDVTRGNFCAVGSFMHGMIEIWDLNVVDQLEPVLVLGQPPSVKTRRRKTTAGNPKSSSEIPGHSGPVLCLHKNPSRSNVLASGSADKTVRLWDLASPTCVETYHHHTDKVQTLNWHPIEESILLTAAYDKMLTIVDVRTPANVLKASLKVDPEVCMWNQHNPVTCWIAMENGFVECYDIRQLSGDVVKSTPLWSFEAHESACTGISDCSVPNVMVTCSLEGKAKVWQVDSGEANHNKQNSLAPKFVFERDLKAGPLFAISNNPDEPTVFSFGGTVPVIWDIAESNVVNNAFGFPLVDSRQDKDDGNNMVSDDDDDDDD